MPHPIELSWTFMVDYAKDWGVLRHAHNYFQMYYCTAGRGVMLLGDRDIVLEKDSCLLIWPGQLHEVYPIKSGQLRTIDTKFYVHDEDIKAALLRAPQVITITDPHFRDLQQTMRNEWVSGALFAKAMAELLFEQSVFLFLRNNAHVSAPPPFYRTLRERTEKLTGLEKTIAEYLSNHFLEDLSLDQIAGNLRYSKNYLCKVFKRASGYTINEYINCLRISKAYDLVCFTNNRLTEIGAQCGFSSIHYFSRTFHRIVGMTPTQTRNHEENSLNTDIRLHGTFRYRYYSKEIPNEKNGIKHTKDR